MLDNPRNCSDCLRVAPVPLAPLTGCARYGDPGGRPGRRNRRALADQRNSSKESKKEGAFAPSLCSGNAKRCGPTLKERFPVARLSLLTWKSSHKDGVRLGGRCHFTECSAAHSKANLAERRPFDIREPRTAVQLCHQNAIFARKFVLA